MPARRPISPTARGPDPDDPVAGSVSGPVVAPVVLVVSPANSHSSTAVVGTTVVGATVVVAAVVVAPVVVAAVVVAPVVVAPVVVAAVVVAPVVVTPVVDVDESVDEAELVDVVLSPVVVVLPATVVVLLDVVVLPAVVVVVSMWFSKFAPGEDWSSPPTGAARGCAVEGHTEISCVANCALLRAPTAAGDPAARDAAAGASANTSTSWVSPLAVSVRMHRAGTVIPVTTVVTVPPGVPPGMLNAGTLEFGALQTMLMTIGPCCPAPSPVIDFVIVNDPMSRNATRVFTSVSAVNGPA